MKGSRLYMIFLFAFLMIVFLFEYMAPHKFVWKPSYDKNDKEPFGSFLFDDILSSSIENYSISNKSLYQIISEDSTVSQHAFLLTEDRLNFNETDIESLYKLIHLGNQVMICTNEFPSLLKDTLNFDISTGGYMTPIKTHVQTMQGSLHSSCIYFGADTLNPEHIYSVFPHFHSTSIKAGRNKWVEESVDSISKKELVHTPVNCDSMEIFVWNNQYKPLVLRAFIGKGEIFLVSTPLMFTNYGLLDRGNASYAFKLLSYMKGKPLIRIESYGQHGDKPRTPLRYLLSEPSLRWAVYSTMILLLLFMAFTAKRHQRIISVVNAPPNRSIEFMQLISNLYFQKNDKVEILKMKHTYFCAEMKSLIGIDLQENIPDKQDYKRLVEKTGMKAYFISQLLKNIQMTFYRSEVSDIQLKEYIDGMNKILNQLTMRKAQIDNF